MAKTCPLDRIAASRHDHPMLRRELNEMPDDIATRLEAEGLAAAYAARPPYQRNDYLGWIARAKRAETREKRIRQMLDELAGGRLYMKMVWREGEGESR